MPQQNIPPLDEKVFEAVKALKEEPVIGKALQKAFDETDEAMKEQIELCEIPAPTFEESVRAEEIARRMKKYGLKDVHIDEIGNVVGLRPGSGNGPMLALGGSYGYRFSCRHRR